MRTLACLAVLVALSPSAFAAGAAGMVPLMRGSTYGRVGSVSAPGGDATLSLAQFTRTYGLRITSEPGSARLVMQGRGVSIALAPGLPVVAINGRAQRLRRSPQVVAGQLTLPRDLVERLPASLREQRVDGVVILDPGHGGHDTGAVSHGLREKDVVLDVAKRAAQKLRARGATVILTRTDDRFVSLSDRSRIANRTPGAAFVSIHANALSSRSRARHTTCGIETFVLAKRISEAYRVNKAAQTYDLQAGDGRDYLSPAKERAAIAALSKEARADSLQLAHGVQKHLVQQTRDEDRQVKQMNLAVLRDTYFGPAILTEIGFLTHPATAEKLKTAAYRDRIAQAIADGVAGFLQQR